MNSEIIIICNIQGQTIDLKIPDDITANSLILALCKNLHLPQDQYRCIRSGNPIALLAGDLPISCYGLHNGSVIYL